MDGPPADAETSQHSTSHRRRRPRWPLPAAVGGVALLAATFGYLTGAQPWEDDAADPLAVVRAMAPAGVACTQVVRVDDAGNARSAVCLTTQNELITVATFTEEPEPDEWAAELCQADLDSVVAAQGAIVVFDAALVTTVAGPLPTEGGGPVPDPDGVAAAVADTLGGSWQRYQCD